MHILFYPEDPNENKLSLMAVLWFLSCVRMLCTCIRTMYKISYVIVYGFLPNKLEFNRKVFFQP